MKKRFTVNLHCEKTDPNGHIYHTDEQYQEGTGLGVTIPEAEKRVVKRVMNDCRIRNLKCKCVVSKPTIPEIFGGSAEQRGKSSIPLAARIPSRVMITPEYREFLESKRRPREFET